MTLVYCEMFRPECNSQSEIFVNHLSHRRKETQMRFLVRSEIMETKNEKCND